jgi:hypothetical protein
MPKNYGTIKDDYDIPNKKYVDDTFSSIIPYNGISSLVISEGTTDGTILVDIDGIATEVNVKGLNTAAYRGTVTSSSKTHTNYGTNGSYLPTMDFLTYWNGAYSSSNSSNLTYCYQGTIQAKPTSLYSNSSGSNGTITLSSSAANFNYLEIYYTRSSDTTSATDYDMVKISSPNNKYASLTMNHYTSSNILQVYGDKIVISGTSITRTAYMIAGLSSSGVSQWTENSGGIFKIYKVLGYK